MKTNPVTELTTLIMEFPVDGDLATTMAYKAMMLVKLSDIVKTVDHLTKEPVQVKGELRVPTIAGELMCFKPRIWSPTGVDYVRFVDPTDDTELTKITKEDFESDVPFHLGALLGILTHGAKLTQK